MRLFVKLMAVIVILALAGPFFIKGPDGRPLMTLADTRASIARAGAGVKRAWQRMTTRVARSAGDDNAGKVPVHRWRDTDGQWHFSDEPPTGVDSEMIFVDPDASRMDPVPARTTAPVPADAGPTKAAPIVSPSQMLDTVDDARSARDSLEERNEELARKIDEH